MTHVLLLCGAVGPLLFLMVATIEGARRPGYRSWRHFVSLLALGERGWIQSANFIVTGALTLAFAIGSARVLASTALPVLFGIFSIALIASGFLPADPALGYPPGTPTAWPPVTTPRGNLHNVAGLLAFASLTIASFLVAHASTGVWRLYSLVSGVGILLGFVTSVVLAERAARGHVPEAPVGIAQRIAIILGWTWLAHFALALANR